MCSCRAFYEAFFFPTENVGSLKTQISPARTKKKSDEKKTQKKTHSLKARQGDTKHVRENSGSNFQKRRGHRHLKEFRVLCLNQPVPAARMLILRFLRTAVSFGRLVETLDLAD